jgi:hypothetical protein
MKTLSKEVIERAIKAKNYKWFSNGELNVVGIRTNDTTTNTYNDFITISYLDIITNKWNFIGFEATTDPGLFWLENPSNVKGTAILVPNQYIDCWQIGQHSGYEAFVQCRPVSVYRYINKDNYLDVNIDTIDTGYFGINIHRSHLTVMQWVIGKYSAGCQVFRNNTALQTLLKLFKASNRKYLTYTLLLENDL